MNLRDLIYSSQSQASQPSSTQAVFSTGELNVAEESDGEDYEYDFISPSDGKSLYNPIPSYRETQTKYDSVGPNRSKLDRNDGNNLGFDGKGAVINESVLDSQETLYNERLLGGIYSIIPLLPCKADMPEIYKRSPTLLNLKRRRNPIPKYLPNLTDYHKFAQHDNSQIAITYRHILHVIWEESFYSKDYDGAYQVMQVISEVDTIRLQEVFQFSEMLRFKYILENNTNTNNNNNIQSYKYNPASQETLSNIQRLCKESIKVSVSLASNLKSKYAFLLHFLNLFISMNCINEFDELLRTSFHENIFQKSSLLLGYHLMFICYKAINLATFIHSNLAMDSQSFSSTPSSSYASSAPSSSPSPTHSRPTPNASNSVNGGCPTLAEVTRDPLQFYHIVTILFQTTDTGLQYSTREDLHRSKTDLASAFSLLLRRSSRRSTLNISFLYIAYLSASGRANKAQKHLSKLLETFPDDPRVHHFRVKYLATIHRKHHQLALPVALRSWILSDHENLSSLHILLLLSKISNFSFLKNHSLSSVENSETPLNDSMDDFPLRFSRLYCLFQITTMIEMDVSKSIPRHFTPLPDPRELPDLIRSWCCWRSLATVLGRLPRLSLDDPVDKDSELARMIPSLNPKRWDEKDFVAVSLLRKIRETFGQYLNQSNVIPSDGVEGGSSRAQSSVGCDSEDIKSVRNWFSKNKLWWSGSILSSHQLGDIVGGITESSAQRYLQENKSLSESETSHMTCDMYFCDAARDDEISCMDRSLTHCSSTDEDVSNQGATQYADADVDVDNDIEVGSSNSGSDSESGGRDNRNPRTKGRENRLDDDDGEEGDDDMVHDDISSSPGDSDDDSEESTELSMEASMSGLNIRLPVRDCSIPGLDTELEARESFQELNMERKIDQNQSIWDEIIIGLQRLSKSPSEIVLGEYSGSPVIDNYSEFFSLESFSLGKAQFDPFSELYWPPRRTSRYSVPYGKCEFILLGCRRLELLTFQIFIAAHLLGQDSPFCARASQILLQHSKHGAGPCIAWLESKGFNFVRAIRMAVMLYMEDVSCVSAREQVLVNTECEFLVGDEGTDVYDPRVKRRKFNEAANL